MTTTHDQIYTWLEEVKDPEIPVLSLVDLGVITGIECTDAGTTIELTPTFVGCPALDIMKSEIVEVLHRKGIANVLVNVNFRVPWTSDRISEKGKIALKNFGLTPPPSTQLFADLDFLEHATCPRCGGVDTVMKSPFGSTLCRSMHYCSTCREAFEQFKPL